MQGAWRPSLSIATVLTSIQLLMSEPNPDDPLVADVVSVCPPGSPTRLDPPLQVLLLSTDSPFDFVSVFRI